MCDKVQYTTYKLAAAALKAIATREKQSFRVYKCSDCLMFHLTSIPTKKLGKMPKEKYKKKWEKRDLPKPIKVTKTKQVISDKNQKKASKQNTYKPFARIFEIIKIT